MTKTHGKTLSEMKIGPSSTRPTPDWTRILNYAYSKQRPLVVAASGRPQGHCKMDAMGDERTFETVLTDLKKAKGVMARRRSGGSQSTPSLPTSLVDRFLK